MESKRKAAARRGRAKAGASADAGRGQGATKRDLVWGDDIVFDRDGEPLSPAARRLAGKRPLRSPPRGGRWVEYLDEELDHRSLADAYLRAHECSGLPEAGAYWRRRLELLEQALEFSLGSATLTPELSGVALASERRDSASPEEARLRRLDHETTRPHIVGDLVATARACIAIAARTDDPFPSYLEGQPHPLVRQVLDGYRRRFRELQVERKELGRAVLIDVIAALDPGIVNRKVMKSELFDRGLEWSERDDLLERW